MSNGCLSPLAAHARLQSGALLVDVRAEHERALGMAEGALGIVREDLLKDPDAHLPDRDAEILLLCQAGVRSLACVQALQALGYRNLASVEGGTRAWEAAGLPMRKPDIDADFSERYSRHLRLPEVGVDGQKKLEAARVLLVGAGGLGAPAAFYLAAAGIGHLRIVDDDVVDRSNLQRQILHADARIGMPKVESAAVALSALNPRTRIEPVRERVGAGNVERLLEGMEVVLDGGDNFPVRYLLNDACVHLGKPLVHGAVHRFDGQASVFDAGRRRGQAPCYRCLFPEPPPAEAAPNCAEAGVLGVLPGVIGLLQATEAIKLVLGIGESLAGRLLQFDALAMRFREFRVEVDPQCPVCAPDRAFTGYPDYKALCAGAD
ncbi:molybdopterin-synthase adenylyltransferase MoeB [Thermomonas sp.]|jgi:molybdopterin/thiamine biosynthesis adenylyltransferase|uniref:molybdopterin-synthase adenylyltransferase MoeB n=1 Tax=Thermomonas sp. TaxID=1971895 RepID=UPI00257A926C|nr:molybdopterin-synthase adenylyltransferase MoeB [Thermomonas sp.]